ncbi:MAG: hypothetical protein QF890_02405 [Myxococcota bacterium]|jgi:alkanesulfonate monooxygenase SsuD/methylene tetrahydromethanopterin reductase-like flavin-dependent oxidoreductase (luciferase family)|nr:LLM class flavin-dependent oxidoreductase [bacterium]MDP6075379.1 hypothetical protein [Myxococcota bacterium]MDP6242790.1 hypothetical protein [Myxococcota bacterium]MDP7073945.1 hypothetical protein [Myxococcota bacterium]MDP7301415.1 hypothetical protein [Myxococcota bacterium]
MKSSMSFGAQIADTSRRGEFQIVHECVEQAALAEEVGFDKVWPGEHHPRAAVETLRNLGKKIIPRYR